MKQNYKKIVKLYVVGVFLLFVSSVLFVFFPAWIVVFLVFFVIAIVTYEMPLIVKLLWKGKPYEGKYKEQLLSFAKKNGITLKYLYVSKSNHSNAHAMGCLNNMGVIYNSITLEKHPEDEIIGIMAHEIGHLQNKDAFVTAPLIAVITIITNMINIRIMWQFSLNLFTLLLGCIIEVLFLLPIVLKINVWRESSADKTAKKILKDPAAFARFLNRMKEMYEEQGTVVFPKHPSFIQKLFATHPLIYKRIAYLEREQL